MLQILRERHVHILLIILFENFGERLVYTSFPTDFGETFWRGKFWFFTLSLKLKRDFLRAKDRINTREHGDRIESKD